MRRRRGGYLGTSCSHHPARLGHPSSGRGIHFVRLYKGGRLLSVSFRVTQSTGSEASGSSAKVIDGRGVCAIHRSSA
jgi:hypothetical protein